MQAAEALGRLVVAVYAAVQGQQAQGGAGPLAPQVRHVLDVAAKVGTGAAGWVIGGDNVTGWGGVGVWQAASAACS